MLKELDLKRKNKIITYIILNKLEWNFFLNKYYPKVVKLITIEHLK